MEGAEETSSLGASSSSLDTFLTAMNNFSPIPTNDNTTNSKNNTNHQRQRQMGVAASTANGEDFPKSMNPLQQQEEEGRRNNRIVPVSSKRKTASLEDEEENMDPFLEGAGGAASPLRGETAGVTDAVMAETPQRDFDTTNKKREHPGSIVEDTFSPLTFLETTSHALPPMNTTNDNDNTNNLDSTNIDNFFNSEFAFPETASPSPPTTNTTATSRNQGRPSLQPHPKSQLANNNNTMMMNVPAEPPAKKAPPNTTSVYVPSRPNDFTETTWWMVDLGLEPPLQQGATALVRRCLRAWPTWDESFARRVLKAYRQYVHLISTTHDYASQKLAPPPLVDQLWKLHAEDTVNYCHDCQLWCGQVFGRNIAIDIDNTLETRQAFTLEQLQKEFRGDQPQYDEEIWCFDAKPKSASAATTTTKKPSPDSAKLPNPPVLARLSSDDKHNQEKASSVTTDNTKDNSNGKAPPVVAAAAAANAALRRQREEARRNNSSNEIDDDSSSASSFTISIVHDGNDESRTYFKIRPETQMSKVFENVPYSKFGLTGPGDARFFLDRAQDQEILASVMAHDIPLRGGDQLNLVALPQHVVTPPRAGEDAACSDSVDHGNPQQPQQQPKQENDVSHQREAVNPQGRQMAVSRSNIVIHNDGASQRMNARQGTASLQEKATAKRSGESKRAVAKKGESMRQQQGHGAEKSKHSADKKTTTKKGALEKAAGKNSASPAKKKQDQAKPKVRSENHPSSKRKATSAGGKQNVTEGKAKKSNDDGKSPDKSNSIKPSTTTKKTPSTHETKRHRHSELEKLSFDVGMPHLKQKAEKRKPPANRRNSPPAKRKRSEVMEEKHANEMDDRHVEEEEGEEEVEVMEKDPEPEVMEKDPEPEVMAGGRPRRDRKQGADFYWKPDPTFVKSHRKKKR